jgi:glycosidase
MAGVQATLSPYSNRFMVCEAPAAPLRFAQSDSCGSSFAFGYQYDLVRAAQGSVADIARIATYWSAAPEGMVGFASNHDSFAGQRLFDQLGGDQKRMQMAAATYLLQTRKPFIYYGEEVGMAGAGSLSGDAKLRTPMSWTNDSVRTGFTTGQPFRALSSNLANANVALQDSDPSSLLNFYRSMITLRRSLPSLQRGTYEAASSSATVMGFQRALGAERTLVALNYGTNVGALQAKGLAASAKLRRLWPVSGGDLQADAAGSVELSLPAQSVAVFAVLP